MVNSRASLAAFVLAALLPALPPAARATLPDYRIGDIVREDIFAPAPLPTTQQNASVSSAPRSGSAADAPLVFRFNPKSPDETEVSLRAAVIMARYHFLRVFQEQLLGRKPTEADLGSPAYTRTVAEVSRNVPASFPFDQLSSLWVRGQSEETLILTLAQPIRQTMANIIVDDATGSALPPEKPLRLIIVKNIAMPLGIRDLDGPGLIVSPSKTIHVSHARQLVENAFPGTQPGLARFAASFVRANTQPDSAATTLLEKNPRPAPVTTTAAKPQQAVLRKGQIIDRQALETITSLREKNPGASFEQPTPAPVPQSHEQRLDGTAPAQPAALPYAPGSAFELTLPDWTLIAVVGGILITLAGTYWLISARKSTTHRRRAIVRRPADELTLVTESHESVWQERARLAEARADQAHAVIRSGALAWMKEKFVGTLFRHRSELLAAQQKAQAEMEQLERRLEQLHAPLQQRIQAYEKRIAELEEKLASKGEENRHLLGARIQLARQQLERSRFESN